MAVRNARLMAGRPAKPASERPEARGRVSFTDMPLISLTRGIGQQYGLGHPPLQPFTQRGAPALAAERFRQLGYTTDRARTFAAHRGVSNLSLWYPSRSEGRRVGQEVVCTCRTRW